ncbi:hypothetical protein P7L54_21050 [Acinetobacter bereziniae]|uniref:Uncharacterized protein n=1 Tax=Acinetobacter bereziniae LMG 1003 = CIP 70.12 TaxID=981324 RepID=N9DKG6_ACIBZ|nr:hypothetical protein [Acinetobacter bereziniae]ENV98316.1 hypothetical protein F938_01170 [Acinetobacter bereziniae LMG 1003 = CIP 70.12]MBJ9908536.1 hypothetical protein [Acinetobacter bereziniae]MBJ9929845.1 hypothetical protein [Acinetobacter bereziniae]MDG3558429.1 hypothetical protein [Acinetobacter bereziniae]MDP6003559.1 hypothetical protein [Acinetobacter bereziniae]
MYTFSIDDEIADIVKQAAKRENRTTRGQFKHLLINALIQQGLYPKNQPKGVSEPIKNGNQNEI